MYFSVHFPSWPGMILWGGPSLTPPLVPRTSPKTCRRPRKKGEGEDESKGALQENTKKNKKERRSPKEFGKKLEVAEAQVVFFVFWQLFLPVVVRQWGPFALVPSFPLGALTDLQWEGFLVLGAAFKDSRGQRDPWHGKGKWMESAGRNWPKGGHAIFQRLVLVALRDSEIWSCFDPRNFLALHLGRVLL